MGSRPSSFRKGGGFLNGVDATITGYQWTDEFNNEPFRPGRDPKTKRERFHSLYFAPTFRIDGADEDVSIHLFAGGYEDFTVSDDGLTLEPNEEGRELGAGTAFAKLLTSLVEAGFPETDLPEDGINYEAIVGSRVRMIQRVDDEATKRLGKKKDKKTGKEYERRDLLVDVYYGKAAETEAPKPEKTKASAKTAMASSKPLTKSKPNGKVPEAEDLQTLAGTALTEILEAAGGSIAKVKLSMKTLTTPSLKGHPQRDDVRKWLFDDNNLAMLVDNGVIEYNKAKQTITTVEATD